MGIDRKIRTKIVIAAILNAVSAIIWFLPFGEQVENKKKVKKDKK